jgi:hypothetical protein
MNLVRHEVSHHWYANSLLTNCQCLYTMHVATGTSSLLQPIWHSACSCHCIMAGLLTHLPIHSSPLAMLSMNTPTLRIQQTMANLSPPTMCFLSSLSAIWTEIYLMTFPCKWRHLTEHFLHLAPFLHCVVSCRFLSHACTPLLLLVSLLQFLFCTSRSLLLPFSG